MSAWSRYDRCNVTSELSPVAAMSVTEELNNMMASHSVTYISGRLYKQLPLNIGSVRLDIYPNGAFNMFYIYPTL